MRRWEGKRGGRTYAVIKETDVVCLPVPADLEVWVLSDLAEEELEDRVGFGFRYSHDTAGEA